MATKNKSYNGKKRSGKFGVGFWICLTSFVLVVAVLFSVIFWRTDAFKDPTFGFGERPAATDEIKDNQDRDDGGLVVSEGTMSHGIRLMRKAIARENFAAYGISPQAESAVTITATVEDKDGNTPEAIQLVSFEWDEEVSSNPSEYLTLTVDGTTATVSCLKPFSHEQVLNCCSVLNRGYYATATFGYLQRITGTIITTDEVEGGTITVSDGGSVDVNLAGYSAIGTSQWEQKELPGFGNFTYSETYTDGISGTSSPNFSYAFTEEFKDKLNEVLPAEYRDKVATSDIMENSQYTQKELLSELLNLDYSQENYIVWYYVMQAFSQTTNQIKLTARQQHNNQYDLQTETYINCKVSAVQIGGVNLDIDRYLF